MVGLEVQVVVGVGGLPVDSDVQAASVVNIPFSKVRLQGFRRMPRIHHCRRGPLVILPYTARVSEHIQRVCRKYGMKIIFRSGLSLRSVLTRVKDPLPRLRQELHR